jgi:hypothetical protein
VFPFAHFESGTTFLLARARACQKADWCNHKKHCGKEKVAKRLPGTIHDPFWYYPVLDTLHHVQPSPNGTAPVTVVGFGVPHPSRTYSPALQRQISLLEGDQAADYFLFDDSDRPIRLVIYESVVKLCFRTTQASAIYSATPKNLDVIAEYLIKAMAHQPGLSRERILAQLQREYGENMAETMAAFEAKVAKRLENGYRSGTTVLESISGNVGNMVQFPEMNVR